MKLGIIIVAMTLMLVLASGEILTKSSPAPSPDLAVNSADSPMIHRAHPPELGSPPSPAQSPIEYSSPPEPETTHSPSPSPSPSNSPPLPNDSQSPSSSSYPSPSPSEEASDINHSDMTGIEGKKSPSGGGGMSGGKKVGVAFGVIAAVCVVGVAGFVCKKRQENIRRSRYGYAANEIL
ncbi:PREDICTED: vegetative cell wall protein gp1-like [Camelina sativa]|uniref:Vegetative cell wall protein gp1-like n=1 Tax=Camelina sativa TaxID=90675 RepID=A0ABM0TG75_CAMSA|nr:PREDICTED: vegetative cell wall protein gp1-like [Camelina sativa]